MLTVDSVEVMES